jgi:predicted TIM-barrel fold metal-dependent hydrolase
MSISKTTRREFLTQTAVGIAVGGAAARAIADPAESGRPQAFIDAETYLGRWPFGRLLYDEPARLVEALTAAGVTQAWAGSFEALLHKDIAGVNARLAVACRRHGDGLLAPFGAVNPTLPDWEDDLRRCDEEHGMPGIRLHPIWHGYKVEDQRVARLLCLAAEQRLIVQLECDAVNVRRPFLALPRTPLELGMLARQVQQAPQVQIVLLADDWSRQLAELPALAAISGVYLAQRRSGQPLGKIAQEVSAGPLLFASGAPLYSPQSQAAAFESSGLSESQQRRLAYGTARELLAAAANAP